MATATNFKYYDPQTLNKIDRLEVRARMVVEGFITGLHKSPYHGFAVEFATHREYTPGDEIKHIDWKVWSKTDRLYIKEYEEETNLRCNIVLDCSNSMMYGDPTQIGMTKFDYGATCAACLAHLLQHQQDAVGLITFNNKIETRLPPKTHPTHRKMIMHELEKTRPSEVSDVGDVFREISEQISRRGMLVLISDLFVDLETLKSSLRELRQRKQDVIIFHVMHEHELTFPFQDMTLFKGLELPQELHTEPRALRKAYLESVDRYLRELRRICATAGVDYVLMNTAKPLDAVLSGYLHARQRIRRTASRR